MIRIEEKQNCCGCRACEQACPKNCITMKADEEGFCYPAIDEDICVRCGLCERVCPVKNTQQDNGGHPEAYAAYSLDETLRSNSSSGGVFSLLAEKILAEGGLVYGAAMEERCVRQIRVASKEEISRLRGSKYVQSDVGETYLQARKDLAEGKTVLYTGTPCQIEGLLHFLGKVPENLVCMDIICHGVPSPMVWDRYCSFQEEKARAQISAVSFREKMDGWKQYAMKLSFRNGAVYRRMHRDDWYMRAFLHDFSLRPSCYQCKFKKVGRISDITLADFWGAQEVCPEMDDDKGLSLVMIHSETGRRLFAMLEKELRWKPVDFQAAIARNRSMATSAEKPEGRERFMQEIQTEAFDKVVASYADRRKGKLRKIFERIVRS